MGRTTACGRRSANWGTLPDLLCAAPAVHAVAERTRQRVAAGLRMRKRPAACGYMGDAYAACLDPDCPDRGQRTHCKSTPGRACCRARVAVIGCTVVTGLCWTRTPVPPANIPARLYDRGIALYMLDRDVRARLAERTRITVGTIHPGLELRGLATRPCQPRANDQEPTRFEERT